MIAAVSARSIVMGAVATNASVLVAGNFHVRAVMSAQTSWRIGLRITNESMPLRLLS
jgi:hypothetical protein